jgi:putative tributyrin esterase
MNLPMRLARVLLVGLVMMTSVLEVNAQSATKAKAAAEPQVVDRKFESKALGRSVSYRMVVPRDYNRRARRYPVLYLLHGLSGSFDSWETRTNLVHYAEKYQFLIAMPDAGDSWYVNSATVPADRYEDFIADDFISEVETNWRVMNAPHRRAIAGLSMGGYGALKFALRHPGVFAFAGSISGALNAPGELATERPDFAKKLSEVFGPAGSETRAKNDIYAMARELKPTDNLYLYVDCGNGDWLLSSNREFAKVLSEKKFRYEYHEFPGMHSWEYWDHRLPDLLESVAKRISQP